MNFDSIASQYLTQTLFSKPGTIVKKLRAFHPSFLVEVQNAHSKYHRGSYKSAIGLAKREDSHREPSEHTISLTTVHQERGAPELLVSGTATSVWQASFEQQA